MTTAKRVIDVTLGSVGLLLFAPVLIVIAALVKAQDGGPVFFRQQRVGRGGRRFHMWKFRTMVPNAGSFGPELTAAGDPRITPLGVWLRSRKLDELPQLFNVLVGEMTLVGPRPEVPKFVDKFTRDQRRVLELRPGVTDRASILFADEGALLAEQSEPERFYVEQILPEKIRINLEYARTATPFSDLVIVFETARRVLLRGPRKPTGQQQMTFVSFRSAN